MTENSLKFFIGAMVSSLIASEYLGASATEARSAGNNYIKNVLEDAEKSFLRVNKSLYRNFKRIGAHELVEKEIEATYDVLAKVLGLDAEDREEVIKHIDSLKKRKKNDTV